MNCFDNNCCALFFLISYLHSLLAECSLAIYKPLCFRLLIYSKICKVLRKIIDIQQKITDAKGGKFC